jgi:hypothetical protein
MRQRPLLPVGLVLHRAAMGMPKKARETAKDALEKRLAEALDKFMDRWLICTQWAGVWAASSATNFNKYASGLATCAQTMAEKPDVASAVHALAGQMEADLKGIEKDAIDSLTKMNADDREQVRTYYTAPWLWNRLDKARWKSAKLALRQRIQRKNSIEVDHIVAVGLWETKLRNLPDALPTINGEPEGLQIEDVGPSVNELGNCMLLEKNFNVSKSNRTLESFLEGVHEFTIRTGTIRRRTA